MRMASSLQSGPRSVWCWRAHSSTFPVEETNSLHLKVENHGWLRTLLTSRFPQGSRSVSAGISKYSPKVREKNFVEEVKTKLDQAMFLPY